MNHPPPHLDTLAYPPLVQHQNRNRLASKGRSLVQAKDSFALVKAYGIPVAAHMFAGTQKETVAAASVLGYPVALKSSSPEISHKSDVGGVRLNIRNQGELRKAYSEMVNRVGEQFPKAAIDGVLIQKMAEGGREVILGAKRDPQFGPVVMFGLGGIYTEVLKDTVCGVAPLTPADAHRMISSIKAAPLIKGIRGETGLDRDFLSESILRLSQLMVDMPEIKEVDLNPVKVYGKGGITVDVRIILESL